MPNINLSWHCLCTLTKIYMMCLLQCLVTCVVKLSAILRYACPMKTNAFHILRALTKLCLFLIRSLPSEGRFRRILWILFWNHIGLICKGVSRLGFVPNKKMRGMGVFSSACNKVFPLDNTWQYPALQQIKWPTIFDNAYPTLSYP